MRGRKGKGKGGKEKKEGGERERRKGEKEGERRKEVETIQNADKHYENLR